MNDDGNQAEAKRYFRLSEEVERKILALMEHDHIEQL
jgi:hypothetical protein